MKVAFSCWQLWHRTNLRHIGILSSLYTISVHHALKLYMQGNGDCSQDMYEVIIMGWHFIGITFKTKNSLPRHLERNISHSSTRFISKISKKTAVYCLVFFLLSFVLFLWGVDNEQSMETETCREIWILKIFRPTCLTSLRTFTCS